MVNRQTQLSDSNIPLFVVFLLFQFLSPVFRLVCNIIQRFAFWALTVHIKLDLELKSSYVSKHSFEQTLEFKETVVRNRISWKLVFVTLSSIVFFQESVFFISKEFAFLQNMQSTASKMFSFALWDKILCFLVFLNLTNVHFSPVPLAPVLFYFAIELKKKWLKQPSLCFVGR